MCWQCQICTFSILDLAGASSQEEAAIKEIDGEEHVSRTDGKMRRDGPAAWNAAGLCHQQTEMLVGGPKGKSVFAKHPEDHVLGLQSVPDEMQP